VLHVPRLAVSENDCFYYSLILNFSQAQQQVIGGTGSDVTAASHSQVIMHPKQVPKHKHSRLSWQ
jgi:hypothetical protein